MGAKEELVGPVCGLLRREVLQKPGVLFAVVDPAVGSLGDDILRLRTDAPRLSVEEKIEQGGPS